MATITETNFLERIVIAFRGDVDGSFKGAHAERFNVIKRDGVEIARQHGRATTIGELAAEGFTWPEVAAEINAGLLITNEELLAQADKLAAEKEAAEEAHRQAVEECSRLSAELDALQAQLVAYQTQVDERGVPKEVTMRQAQLALLGAGLLDKVEQAIFAIPGDAGRAAQITWAKSGVMQRSNPLIKQLQEGLQLTDDMIDALFVTASKL